ncbi:hypothetical protein [Rothia kristinae]|uniref:hypothetical protein n=1 Tax=Rothia kristinae TaxID=37923 RepID=UPI0022E92394|nr:hypothetical protein [Rothia kristinae]
MTSQHPHGGADPLPEGPVIDADPAPAPQGDEELLGCGRTMDSVWETLDEPADAHQRSCEYCTRARESLTSLSSLTEQAREEEQKLAPAPSLLARVMDFARVHVRRSHPVLAFRDETSEMSVSQAAVASRVRRTVDSFPGLIARRCRVSTEEGALPDGEQPLHLRVSMNISPESVYTHYDRNLRTAIIEDLHDELGLRAQTVDLEIEDINDRV